VIGADDRVSSVLARDEKLVDVFVEFSPAFKMLRNPLQRKTMAKLVTIAQAARIAGVDASMLLARLNDAIGETENGAQNQTSASATVQLNVAPEKQAPPGLLETPAERIVDLDVREDLREGREPLRRILETVKTVPKGSIFRLRATFEPVPLFTVLGRQGFANFSERFADDDWRVWFYRDEVLAQAAANPVHAEVSDLPDDGDMVILDVRGLEPPEPMMRTLEALAALPPGKTLLQINQRVPQFLLPKIRERGFTYEIREQSRDLVRIFIQHQQQP